MSRGEQKRQLWAKRAAEFHARNPHVYAALVDLAREVRATGAERTGIELLWNVLRWRQLFETEDTHSTYKLNSGYKRWYAEQMMEREPDLAGFFETRAPREVTA